MFRSDRAKFVAESQSRNHFPFDRDKICRREPFSKPCFGPAEQNLSQRAVLVTTFEFDEAKFVAESCSRNHFRVRRSKTCRREPFSKPCFGLAEQNLSQRAVLVTTFHSIETKFVAESCSRNHFRVRRSKICRREPFSEPLSSQSKQNLSQRAVLVTTFEFDEAKFVAESCSQSHISVRQSKICRRELFSKPLSIRSRQNLSQRTVLVTTFQSIVAEFVAEGCSRNHISVHRSRICRREPFS